MKCKMPAEVPDVSVIIVNYNTRDLLLSCLRSLFEESIALKVEVIVVDNASTDDSAQIVLECFPTVLWLANQENVGFARATNQGINASSGRYALLLNPDTLILERAIERMVEFMDRHVRIGACGCKLVYPDGRFQPSAFPFPSLLDGIYKYSGLFERVPYLARRLTPERNDSEPGQTRRVAWCSGACLAVSRTCIEEIGLLDESFFLYAEEVDWCRRMQRANWPVYYFPEVSVVHYLGGSQNNTWQFKRRLTDLEGNLHYLRKWHGPGYALMYQWIVSMCGLYRYSKYVWRRMRSTRGAPEASGESKFY